MLVFYDSFMTSFCWLLIYVIIVIIMNYIRVLFNIEVDVSWYFYYILPGIITDSINKIDKIDGN
jgi:hypothetical protein